ncbi:MAG: hypothetical protein ACTS8Y_01855 [Arsenophonus sp. ER-EMS1-MAG3]
MEYSILSDIILYSSFYERKYAFVANNLLGKILNFTNYYNNITMKYKPILGILI